MRLLKLLLPVFTLVSIFAISAFADVQAALATPNSALDTVIAFLTAHAGAIGSALGTALVVIGKVFPNSNASGVVAVVQAVVDGVAGLIIKLGQVLQQIAQVLANVLQSDGYLGKK